MNSQVPPPRSKEYVILVLVALPLLVWAGYYAGKDLWWDEIVALRELTLVDFQTTVTLYPKGHGNHHTFYNLVNNLYTRALHARDLGALSENVYVVRLLPFLFGVVAVAYVYKLGKRFFGPHVAQLSCLILCTSVPFLNFVMQLRGYSMSMAFAAMTTYYSWSFMREKEKRDGFLLLLSSFALLYTMPSNLYFIVSLVTISLVEGVRALLRGRLRPRASSHFFTLLILSASVILFVAAYSPLLDDFLRFKFAVSHPPSRFYVLTDTLPVTLRDVTSFRYLIVIAFHLGLVLFFRSRRRKDSPKADVPREFEYSIALCFLPFLFSFVRNEQPFLRTFVYLIPMWSLTLAVGMGLLIDQSKWLTNRAGVFKAICWGYCLLAAIYAHVHIQDHLYKSILDGRRDQEVFYNFYESNRYKPSRDVGSFAEVYDKQPLTVMVVDEVDRVALDLYLQKHGIDYYCTIATVEVPGEGDGQKHYVCKYIEGKGGRVAIKEFHFRSLRPIEDDEKLFTPLYSLLVSGGKIPAREPQFYVVTSFPEKLANMTEGFHRGMELLRISEDITYTNVFLARHRVGLGP